MRGKQVYVVNGYGARRPSACGLSGHADTARTVGVPRADGLDRPTTGAHIGGSLYVVNGRFGTLRSDPDADVYITRPDAR